MDSTDRIRQALPTPTPLLIVISGYSGVGKDTVIKAMAAAGIPFHFVVTATSRAPREGEVPGVDYHFFPPAEFEERIAKGEFLEHANVYDQYKGVPKWEVSDAMASGQDVVMRLDVQGAATIRKLVPEALLIFISTESEEELVGRLRARGTETPETLRRRLEKVGVEAETIPLFDYVVINRDGELDRAVECIRAILAAEKARVTPRVARI